MSQNNPESRPSDEKASPDIQRQTATERDSKGDVSDKEQAEAFTEAAPTQPVRSTSVPQTAELSQTGILSPGALESPHSTKRISIADLADRYQITPSLAEEPEKGLIIFLPGHPTPMSFGNKDVVTIGRRDQVNNIIPELDLTAHHGAELGVSRFHAVITRVSTQYHIKDMGSTNGTRINGKKIPPYTLTPIKRNDQVQIGHLTIVIG